MSRTADAKKVWEAWRKYKPRPNLCRFTKDREKTISARLALGYEPSDLITLIEYIHKGDTGFCRWMRGDNPRNRQYLDLENIFRKEKLGGRVEEALNWLAAQTDGGKGPPRGGGGSDLDLGPMAHLQLRKE